MFSTALELASLLEKFNTNVDEIISVCDKNLQHFIARQPPLQVQCPQNPITSDENLFLVAPASYIPNFHSAKIPCHGMRVVVAQGGNISPVLFSLYLNDMLKTSRHFRLSLYAEIIAVVATSRSPSIFVCYILAHFFRLRLCLRDWGNSIKVCKGNAILFTKSRNQIPRLIQFLGEPVAWVETARYLEVTLDTRLT
jgi:hypothetical protein